MKRFLKKGLAVALSALFVLSGCSASTKSNIMTGGSVSADEDEPSGYEIVSAATNLDFQYLTMDLKADIEIEDSLLNILEENNIELYDISKAGINLKFARQNELFSFDAVGLLNDFGTVSVNLTADPENGYVYFEFPQFSDVALCAFDESFITDIDFATVDKAKTELSDVLKVILNSKLGEICKNLSKTAVDAVGEPDDVYGDEIDAGGKSKAVSAESYFLSPSDIGNIYISVLEELKTDDSFTHFVMLLIPEIIDLSDAYGFDATPLHEAYLNDNFIEDVYIPAIDEAIEYVRTEIVNEDDADVDYMEIVVFYDGEDFAGMEICDLSYDYSKKLLGLYKVVNGEEFTMEFIMPDENFVMTADGTMVNDLFTGNLIIKSQDVETFNLILREMDIDKLRYGLIDGTIVIDESTFCGNIPEELEGYKLEADISNDVLSTDVVVRCYFEEEPLATAQFSFVLSDDGTNVSVPTSSIDINDDEAFGDWISGISFDSILENLEQAGVDTEIFDTVWSVMGI